jgi:GTPase
MTPEGVDAARDRDLEGRGRHPVIRRGILALLLALVVVALFNVFGQQTDTSHASGRGASIVVDSPARVRGGLIFQARFTVTAATKLQHPVLVLQRGWLESMSVNSIVPDPSQQSSTAQSLQLSLDPMEAGDTTVIRIYFQVNPTNVGRRGQDVTVADGNTTLVTVHRSITIFP